MYTALTLAIAILASSSYFMIQIPGTVASSESKLLQQTHQNQSYIATLTGDNTSTTGFVKFITNPQYYSNNELYYEINLTNIRDEVIRIDIHLCFTWPDLFGSDEDYTPCSSCTIYCRSRCIF